MSKIIDDIQAAILHADFIMTSPDSPNVIADRASKLKSLLIGIADELKIRENCARLDPNAALGAVERDRCEKTGGGE